MEKELGLKLKENNELCEPCIYDKAHRLPFGNRNTANKPGELIWADVWGFFPVSFQDKDNFTKFRYGYFIANKSEVIDTTCNEPRLQY